MVNERLKICETCPSKNGLLCGECGCVLLAKAAIPFSQCPLNKWTEKKDRNDIQNI